MAARNLLALKSGTLLDEARNPASVADRRRRLAEPHVAALEEWAQVLREGTGESIPSFDPSSGGVGARLLVLREEPRCLATQGSGFVSIDNDDAAAHNTSLALAAGGIDRAATLHWNVVPWWIRNPDTAGRGGSRTVLGQARRAQEDVAGLLAMLPDLRVVLLLGREAARAWAVAGVPGPAVLTGPHPSPLAWNTRDASTGRPHSELTIEAFARAADLLDVPDLATLAG